tara:strand:- start:129 stop:863 length:735 start_codon:yes stop_codon:yes gene_type:complete
MWPKITKKYSLNFSLPKRKKQTIKFIILHYTGMKKETLAIERLCDPKSKVSTHYFIKKNGEILRLVPDLYQAWHAGISSWQNFKSLNKYSLGIEIQNSGHDYLFENFSKKQIKSLKRLLKILIKTYNIDKKKVLGHSDIAPLRKKDPGEKFPWRSLFLAKLSSWHNLSKNRLKKYRFNDVFLNEKKEFLKILNKLGYNNLNNYNSDKINRILTKAFQRRFRQELINGKIDKECLIIAKNLLKQK